MRVCRIGIAGVPPSPLGLESPLFMRVPENHLRRILMSKNLKVKILKTKKLRPRQSGWPRHFRLDQNGLI
jgi:hypothetical protein